MQRRYVHGANPGVDDPIAWFSSSSFTAAATRHLFANPQGSVVLSGDSAGNALRIFAYDEYGVPTTAGGAAQLTAANGARFGFTGQAWIPELGMYHYKARVYSPTLGRFMQTDPIGYDDQINLYAYVGNDPVNKSDPTGMITDTQCRTMGSCTIYGAPDGTSMQLVLPRLAANTSTLGQTPTDWETLDEGEDAKWMSSVGGALKNAAQVVGRALRISPKAADSATKIVQAPKNWKPPVQSPQLPPKSVPSGWRLREMGPNSLYPKGYWRLEKPMANGGWQGINPSTIKPGPQWETHIPLP